jgi:DNA-binding NarL/FixJ family response regulator
MVRIAVIDSDPLRFIGFRAWLSAESNFELESVAMAEIGTQGAAADLVLLGTHPGKSVINMLTTVKVLRPGLNVIVTGYDLSDAAILKAISAGAKGCVDEAASVGELVRAIRAVLTGSIWAPRRVLSMFVDQAYRSSEHVVFADRRPFTSREKEVLQMLVAGRSNKEIAAPLGIEERTVKAHVAKLFRKVGVSNRVMLSVYATAHSLADPKSIHKTPFSPADSKRNGFYTAEALIRPSQTVV